MMPALDQSIIYNAHVEIDRADDIITEYIELLRDMKLRDPRLDPIWMEQYATKKLEELAEKGWRT